MDAVQRPMAIRQLDAKEMIVVVVLADLWTHTERALVMRVDRDRWVDRW